MSILSPAVAIGGGEEGLRNRMGIGLCFCVIISRVLAVSLGAFLSVHISQHMGGHGDALSPRFSGKAGWADHGLGQ